MKLLSVIITVLAFGFILPASFALGIIQSRRARLLETAGAGLAILGIWLPGGNSFIAYRILNVILTILIILVAIQLLADYSLLATLSRWKEARHARYINLSHYILRGAVLALGWIQLTSGSMDTLELVTNHRVMLAHTTPALLLIVLSIIWLSAATGLWRYSPTKSPDYYDSLCCTAIGIILLPIVILSDFFWKEKNALLDVPVHIFFLFMMLAAGQVGQVLSRDTYNRNRPCRNLLPSLIAVLFGQLMVAHHQHSPLAKTVHEGFGYSFMATGMSRAVEILVLPFPAHSPIDSFSDMPSEREHLRFLPPMFLTMAAFMILFGADDIVAIFERLGIRPPGYLAMLQAVAFGYFLFMLMLIRKLAVGLHANEDPKCDPQYEYDEFSCDRDMAERQSLASQIREGP